MTEVPTAPRQIIEKLSRESDAVHGIKFRRNYGKSPALYCGFEKAQGDVVITMDADLQDSPDEIPELYQMITEDDYDRYPAGKGNVTIRFQKPFLQKYSMQRHAKYPVSKTCTTLIAA